MGVPWLLKKAIGGSGMYGSDDGVRWVVLDKFMVLIQSDRPVWHPCCSCLLCSLFVPSGILVTSFQWSYNGDASMVLWTSLRRSRRLKVWYAKRKMDGSMPGAARGSLGSSLKSSISVVPKDGLIWPPAVWMQNRHQRSYTILTVVKVTLCNVYFFILEKKNLRW